MRYGRRMAEPARTERAAAAAGRGGAGRGSACKMMERNRNVALGGPGGLRQLQDEGYLVVVAAIDRLRLRPGPVPAGTRIVSSSAVDARRARVVFRQVLLPCGGPQPGGCRPAQRGPRSRLRPAVHSPCLPPPSLPAPSSHLPTPVRPSRLPSRPSVPSVRRARLSRPRVREHDQGRRLSHAMPRSRLPRSHLRRSRLRRSLVPLAHAAHVALGKGCTPARAAGLHHLEGCTPRRLNRGLHT